jgi:type 1 fimbriae regulatory protein FimB
MLGDELRSLKRYLKERANSSLPWLFITERGEQFTRFGINYLLRAISGRSALPFHVHPHMLRHGCGYALANRGRDTRLIQDYLGHRDIKHTARYTRTASVRFESVWD